LLSTSAAVAADDTGVDSKDQLQIDWVIPAEAFAAAVTDHPDANLRYEVKFVPRRLFRTTANLIGADGELLLPVDAELFAMIGAKRALCSQGKYQADSAGANNRVCIVDEDGDGAFDSYFLRGLGKSFWTTDKMWFAMNDYFPTIRRPLKSAGIAEADRLQAKNHVAATFDYTVTKAGTVDSVVSIERSFRFVGSCAGDKPTVPAPIERVAECGISGQVFRATNFGAKKRQDRVLSASGPGRDVTVRFDVAPRLFGARLMNGVYFD
jgi:hypothetical protein